MKTVYGIRPMTPWVREHLKRSIWKEDDSDGRDLRRCPTKELEGRKRSISIHMGKPLLVENIEVLGLSVRSYNCLKRAGIMTIDDLMNRISSEDDLLKIRNLGKKSSGEILEKLEGYQRTLLQGDNKVNPLQGF